MKKTIQEFMYEACSPEYYDDEMLNEYLLDNQDFGDWLQGYAYSYTDFTKKTGLEVPDFVCDGYINYQEKIDKDEVPYESCCNSEAEIELHFKEPIADRMTDKNFIEDIYDMFVDEMKDGLSELKLLDDKTIGLTLALNIH